MSNISMFDIIGPNMIGPSSSHTAGALRIALLAGKMVPTAIQSVTFTLYGSFAKTYRGHGTDRALVGGILGYDTEDARIKDSMEYAKESGLAFAFIEDHTTVAKHPNTVGIHMVPKHGDAIDVTGISVGGGRVNITQFNDVEIDFSGEYHTIIVKQIDTPGIVASITQCLAQSKINIAFMRLYRQKKGEYAYTIIEADQPIGAEVLKLISAYPNILEATIIPMA